MAGTDTVSLNCSLSNCFMPLTDSGGRIVKASIFLIVLKILVVLIISNERYPLLAYSCYLRVTSVCARTCFA